MPMPLPPAAATSVSGMSHDACRSGTLMSVVEVTVFELVGGQPFFDDLVERFYGHVEADARLRAVYPDDLAPGKRALARFLGQYWGGPPVYSAEKGHPRLRMRHAPFTIDPAARDAWLRCMLRALDEAAPPRAAADAMREYFEMAATAMINAGATMAADE
jgi:hemoglobin